MEDINNSPAWLGRGWAFPPEFDPRAGGVTLVTAAEDITQSLEILLATAPGERVMNPSYGCGLRALVFENINEGTITQVRDTIQRAVLFFEPRIILDSVSVDVTDVYRGLMRIQLDYTIKSTNSRGNIVYPFYFQEGTSVPSTLG